jgi:hypothetical protein
MPTAELLVGLQKTRILAFSTRPPTLPRRIAKCTIA